MLNVDGKAEINVTLPGDIDVRISVPLGAGSAQSVWQIISRLAGIMIETDEDEEDA